MTKKLFRVTAILPRDRRERKHRAPVHIVLAESAEEAKEIMRKEWPSAMTLHYVCELEDENNVRWTWHSFWPEEVDKIMADPKREEITVND